MALKNHEPAIPFAGEKITPDEMGYDQFYMVINPSIDSSWFGTVSGTQTQTGKVLVLKCAFADYPRNLRLTYVGASGSVVNLATGTINGLDQFGSTISETYAGTPAADGGTIVGTAVFSKVTSGTFNLGTGDAGPGTVSVGVGTGGTTTKFGLPSRLGGTTDIKLITGAFNGVGTSTMGTFVFGGTPSSAADTTYHAFKAPRDVAAGTCVYIVKYRSSYSEVRPTTYIS